MTREEAKTNLIAMKAKFEMLLSMRGLEVSDVFDVAIEALSAEPCEDAISRQAVLDVTKREMFMGDAISEIEKLPSVTPKQKMGRWIPVSERLPEKTGLYLVSIGDLVCSKSFDGHNFRTESQVRFIPDAWMPLPEPYKAESEDTDGK